MCKERGARKKRAAPETLSRGTGASVEQIWGTPYG